MNAPCPICSGALGDAFEATVLGRHRARYEHCAACGFLRAREPHWLAEAYSTAIAATDTGVVERNLAIARRLASLLHFGLGERGAGRYLDAAGGSGLLVRLMRDSGFEFFWSDKYCDNLLARGFEFAPEFAPCAAVTAFEVMEHLENPAAFVAGCLAQSGADTFVFTTELYAGAPPAPADWWYYSLETGQHIAFFRRDTLEALAARLGMKFHSAGGLHLFTRRRLSQARLRLCASRLSRVLAPLARARLGGKVQGDHAAMIARLRGAGGASG